MKGLTMIRILALATLVLAGCATPGPDVKTDNIKDGTVVCATLVGPWGSGKTVVTKLDQGVIRDGGTISIDGNCLMTIQLTPPAPKLPPTIKVIPRE
jgi:hypothetical protein